MVVTSTPTFGTTHAPTAGSRRSSVDDPTAFIDRSEGDLSFPEQVLFDQQPETLPIAPFGAVTGFGASASATGPVGDVPIPHAPSARSMVFGDQAGAMKHLASFLSLPDLGLLAQTAQQFKTLAERDRRMATHGESLRILQNAWAVADRERTVTRQLTTARARRRRFRKAMIWLAPAHVLTLGIPLALGLRHHAKRERAAEVERNAFMESADRRSTLAQTHDAMKNLLSGTTGAALAPERAAYLLCGRWLADSQAPDVSEDERTVLLNGGILEADLKNMNNSAVHKAYYVQLFEAQVIARAVERVLTDGVRAMFA